MLTEIVVFVLAGVGALVLAVAMGLPAGAWIAAVVRRNAPRALPITVCPTCRRWSPKWCNRTDWYGDGHDCRKDEFVRVNSDGSLRKLK